MHSLNAACLRSRFSGRWEEYNDPSRGAKTWGIAKSTRMEARQRHLSVWGVAAVLG